MKKNLTDIMKTVSSLKNKKNYQFSIKNENETQHVPKNIANTINSYIKNVPRTLQKIHRDKIKPNISKMLINKIKPIKFTNKEYKKMNEPIKVKEIEEQIKILNVKKAIGYDELDQEMLKKSISISKIYLTALLNHCYHNGKIPKLFKLGKIIPIPKEEGNCIDIAKIRPISLLSVVSKIMEKLY